MRALLPISLFAIALALPDGAAAAHTQRAPGWIGIGFEVWSGEQVGSQRPSAIVTEVRDGSPAATAGIEVGDRLLAINGARTTDEFANLADRLALRVGDPVDITLLREGRRMQVSLRAAQRPTDFATWPGKPAVPVDSMVETMFRAMDSLRVQILASTGVQVVAAPRAARATSVSGIVAGAPAGPQPVSAPFEFFVFRGEQHDSLRLEMDALNRRIDSLREQERRLSERRAARTASRAQLRELDAQLAEVESALQSVMLESSELRAAMAEAARVSAGIQYEPGFPADVTVFPGAVEPEPFRPLTPYLLGSNRVAGAEVIDLRPGLAEYFRVDGGVLVVDVAPGTPAATAGIQAGDVIVNLDRVGVRSVDALRLGISRAGDTLPVTLVRRGSSLEVLLRRR
jgi:membrane-associated protease RseP (regulator of RpoE activity)